MIPNPKFREVESVHPTSEGICINFEHPIGGRMAKLLEGKEASDFVKGLRSFKRRLPEPGERIIDGLDNFNKAGTYDRDIELEAIKKSLTLRELRKYRELDEKACNYLTTVTCLNDTLEAFEAVLMARSAVLMADLKASQEIISEKTPQAELDALNLLCKNLKLVVGLNKTTRGALLEILNSWFEPFGEKS